MLCVGEQHLFGNVVVVTGVLNHLLCSTESHPCVGGGRIRVGVFEIDIQNAYVGVDERTDTSCMFYVESGANIVVEGV